MTNHLLATAPEVAEPGTAVVHVRRYGGRLPDRAVRYGTAVVAVAAGAGLRWLIQDVLGKETPFITLLPAVVLVAMLAGGGPGLLATLLSDAVAGVWFLAGVPAAGEVVILALFTASGVVVQGRRSLWPYAGKHLEQELVAPAARPPLHRNAVLAGMLFEQG